MPSAAHARTRQPEEEGKDSSRQTAHSPALATPRGRAPAGPRGRADTLCCLFSRGQLRAQSVQDWEAHQADSRG